MKTFVNSALRFKRSFYPLSAALLAVGHIVLFVFVATAQQAETNLPGHLKGQTQALTDGMSVAVATLKSIGRRDLGAAGVYIYSYVDLKIDERLKGDSIGEVVGTFSRVSSPETLKESVPVEGHQYIIFFQHGRHNYPGQAYTIAKFTAYSVEERDKLKKLIEQLGKG
jgi:hypothetical protein